MRPAPLAQRGHGWCTDLYGRTVDGLVVEREVHVYPLADAMPHVIPAANCWCGPDIDYSATIPLVTHASLDGRELAEP